MWLKKIYLVYNVERTNKFFSLTPCIFMNCKYHINICSFPSQTSIICILYIYETRTTIITLEIYIYIATAQLSIYVCVCTVVMFLSYNATLFTVFYCSTHVQQDMWHVCGIRMMMSFYGHLIRNMKLWPPWVP